MYKELYERLDMPTQYEGEAMLAALRERGIVVKIDELETKVKLVRFGLTPPAKKDDWLAFATPLEEALYVFTRLRDPAEAYAGPCLAAMRFDIARYRSSPLEPELGVGEACSLFRRVITAMMGRRCTFAGDGYSCN